jgi:hypothetical protein
MTAFDIQEMISGSLVKKGSSIDIRIICQLVGIKDECKSIYLM